MIIRKYKPSDCAFMAKLFYDTVHTINSKDYTGYLDKLYVHKDFQRRGIATALVKELERCARKVGLFNFKTHASITAKPFFEKQGYTVEAENKVIRNGIALVNYKMVKNY